MLLKDIEEEMMDKLGVDKNGGLSWQKYFSSEKPVKWEWMTESKQQRVSGARISLVMWVHIQAD